MLSSSLCGYNNTCEPALTDAGAIANYYAVNDSASRNFFLKKAIAAKNDGGTKKNLNNSTIKIFK